MAVEQLGNQEFAGIVPPSSNLEAKIPGDLNSSDQAPAVRKRNVIQPLLLPFIHWPIPNRHNSCLADIQVQVDQDPEEQEVRLESVKLCHAARHTSQVINKSDDDGLGQSVGYKPQP
eukprot:6459568-Amphidinium_carterae.2